MATNEIKIIPFSEIYSDVVKRLNNAWLEKYFRIEPIDEKNLSNPKQNIIDKGGYIFLAEYNAQIVGTISLIKANEITFELSKMAVDENIQGKGIGSNLLSFTIEFCKSIGVKKLILFSNTKLKSAIHLYRKYGFEEVELERKLYERADIKMQLVF